MNRLETVYFIFQQHIAHIGITPANINEAISSLAKAKAQASRPQRKRFEYAYYFTIAPAGIGLDGYEGNVVWRYYPTPDYQIVFLAFPEDRVTYTAALLWGISQGHPKLQRRFERWIGRKLGPGPSRTGQLLTIDRPTSWLIETSHWNLTYGMVYRLLSRLKELGTTVEQVNQELTTSRDPAAGVVAFTIAPPGVWGNEHRLFQTLPFPKSEDFKNKLDARMALFGGNVVLAHMTIPQVGQQLVVFFTHLFSGEITSGGTPVVPLESWNRLMDTTEPQLTPI